MSIEAINTDICDSVRWDDKGLVPAIAQDSATGKILMFAWMNRDSLQLTIDEGIAVYWSRSRQQLWRKGESSGFTQKIKEIRIDCDDDVLLLTVEQIGGIACHTGRESCFYRVMKDGKWQTVEPVIQSPDDIYKK